VGKLFNGQTKTKKKLLQNNVAVNVCKESQDKNMFFPFLKGTARPD
jgi:hypothetical protein